MMVMIFYDHNNSYSICANQHSNTMFVLGLIIRDEIDKFVLIFILLNILSDWN